MTTATALNISVLEQTPREELIQIASDMGVEGAGTLRKSDLIFRVLQTQAEARGNIFSGGFLEISDDGNYGFLRGESMLPGPHDIYVSQSQLRRFALRPGDYVTGAVRHPKDNEKYYGLLKVEAVNGMDPETAKRRPFFENLTAIFPNQQLMLETTARQPHRSRYRPRRADRPRPARAHRLAAEGRQDDAPQEHCQRYRGEPPGRAPHGRAHR